MRGVNLEFGIVTNKKKQSSTNCLLQLCEAPHIPFVSDFRLRENVGNIFIDTSFEGFRYFWDFEIFQIYRAVIIFTETKGMSGHADAKPWVNWEWFKIRQTLKHFSVVTNFLITSRQKSVESELRNHKQVGSMNEIMFDIRFCKLRAP